MFSKKKTKMTNKKIGVAATTRPAKAVAINQPAKAIVINRPVKVTAINQPSKVAVSNPPRKAAAINPHVKTGVINRSAKDLADLQKLVQNVELISKFVEKTGGRYEIRMKLDKTLWNYLTEIKLVLPILDKIKFKELYLNLMEILGYFFYISIFIHITSNNYILTIYLIDSVIEYGLKRNTEIVNCDGNVLNGIVGMKRDINLQLLVFFHSYDDVKEVSVN
jgi:hypothetical protein